MHPWQDPSYPVYVDTSVMMGMTGPYKEDGTGFEGIQYMVCRPENEFFPDLSKVGCSWLGAALVLCDLGGSKCSAT